MNIQEKMIELLKTQQTILDNYAKAKSEYERLDSLLKPRLAQIQERQNGSSNAERERKGLADLEYEKFVTERNNAYAEYMMKWAAYKDLENAISLCQSINKAQIIQYNENL